MFLVVHLRRFVQILFVQLSQLHSQHLLGQNDGLHDVLRLVVPQHLPVLTVVGTVEGDLPGPPDLAVGLVQVDVRLVEEEGEDTGVKSVSDDHSGAAVHGDGAPEHLHEVKLSSLIDNFVFKVRSFRDFGRAVEELAIIPPVDKVECEVGGERTLVQNVPDLVLVTMLDVFRLLVRPQEEQDVHLLFLDGPDGGLLQRTDHEGHVRHKSVED